MVARIKSPVGQISDTDLRLLKVFRTVVESGGFSQAEVELNISGPAISISMSDLEGRLGFRLCQRGRAGFSLTDEGRQVYEASRQLFTSLESFRSEVNTIHQQLKGELAIGVSDNLVTLPRMRITYALKSLKQKGPDVTIRIRMDSPTAIETAILNGQLHVGVVPHVHQLKGLDYSNLYHEEVRLYCGFGHALFDRKDQSIGRKELHNCEAINCGFPQPAAAQKYLQRFNLTATASDREGIAFLILTGLYIGFLPEHFAKRWVDDGRMRTLSTGRTQYDIDYVAVTRKSVRPNLILETFLDEVAKYESH